MLRSHAIIREAAQRISQSIEASVQALKEERVEQEPTFTDRMLGRIEQSMEGFQSKGITWSAKTLTSLGPGSQESIYGADFLGVLSIDIPGYKVSKGFLAQAKLIEKSDNISPKEYERMQDQCKKMLSLSPSSFVFLYSKTAVSIVPAISIVSSIKINPHLLYSRTSSRFYMDHFSSFVGDKKINIPHAKALESLLQEFNSRSGIFLKASNGQNEGNVLQENIDSLGESLVSESSNQPIKQRQFVKERIHQKGRKIQSSKDMQKWHKMQEVKKKQRQLVFVKLGS